MRLIALAIIVTLVVGCGPRNGPKTAPVKGTVTLEGKPLPNVGVTFFPTKKGPIAIGNTNENGEFTLTTVRRGDGATIGKHQVAIGAVEEGKKLLPIADRYSSPHTAALTAEVKAGEKNVFTFDLKPEDPPAVKSKAGRPK